MLGIDRSMLGADALEMGKEKHSSGLTLLEVAEVNHWAFKQLIENEKMHMNKDRFDWDLVTFLMEEVKALKGEELRQVIQYCVFLLMQDTLNEIKKIDTFVKGAINKALKG